MSVEFSDISHKTMVLICMIAFASRSHWRENGVDLKACGHCMLYSRNSNPTIDSEAHAYFLTLHSKSRIGL